jgi:hypothetical protein
VLALSCPRPLLRLNHCLRISNLRYQALGLQSWAGLAELGPLEERLALLGMWLRIKRAGRD